MGKIEEITQYEKGGKLHRVCRVDEFMGESDKVITQVKESGQWTFGTILGKAVDEIEVGNAAE